MTVGYVNVDVAVPAHAYRGYLEAKMEESWDAIFPSYAEHTSSVAEEHSRLAPEVQDDLVHTIPCELTKDDCLFALTAGGMKLPWYAWRVMAPKTGEYKVSAECEGDARLKLLLKESRLIAEGKAGEKLSGKVTLTKGLHVFKLRFVGGKCEAPKLSVADR